MADYAFRTESFTWGRKYRVCLPSVSWSVSNFVSATIQILRHDVHRAVHRNITSIVKPTGCTNGSNLFYFGMTPNMFRVVFTSIIKSSRLYIQ